MNFLKDKIADEIRGMWQARVLTGSKDKMHHVVLVALAKAYPAAFQTLLRALGAVDISRPFFCGYAAITPSGRIVCDMIDRDGSKRKVAVYRDENEFIYEMRTLADRLKLSDSDRTEFFGVLQKWVTRDERVNLHGEKKLVS